jgi:hypothetical protein
MHLDNADCVDVGVKERMDSMERDAEVKSEKRQQWWCEGGEGWRKME